MSVKIENGKCKLSELTDLRIKRYLSQTRSYFREGVWVRDFFAETFPTTGVEESGELYFDLKSLKPPCDPDATSDLNKTKVTPDSLSVFKQSIEKYSQRIEAGRLSFNEELSSSEFSLPDPREHPELYLISKTETNVRLVILWGLESTRPSANQPLDKIIQILEEHFMGKSTSLKAIKPKAVKLPKTDPKPSPKPAKPEPKKTPTEKELPPKAEQKKTHPEKKEPSKKPKASKPTPQPKPHKEQEPFEWSKLRWLRNSLICLILIAAIFFGGRFGAIRYLGEPIQVNTLQNNTATRTIPVGANQELVFPNGEVFTSETENTVLIPPFRKPGNYRFLRRDTGETNGEEVFIKYANSRNDMLDLPVASLGISENNITLEDPVSLSVNQSFHESPSNKALTYSIDWGDSESGFEPIENPETKLSHSYSKSGSYRISLLVKDQNGNWDYDFETITVSGPDKELSISQNLPPIADAEIMDIAQNEKGYLVTIKLDGSYDLDGELETITVDWGDNNTRDLQGNVEKVSRQFPKRSNRTTVRVSATDNKGLSSTKPALLEIDFRSDELNDPQRFTSIKNGLVLSESTIKDESELFILSKSVSNKAIRNKKYQRFAIQTPKSKSSIVFKDITWNIQGRNIKTRNLKGVNELEILAADGIYVLNVSATDLDNNSYQIKHRFTVRIKKTLPLHIKIATWLSESLSAIKN